MLSSAESLHALNGNQGINDGNDPEMEWMGNVDDDDVANESCGNGKEGQSKELRRFGIIFKCKFICMSLIYEYAIISIIG